MIEWLIDVLKWIDGLAIGWQIFIGLMYLWLFIGDTYLGYLGIARLNIARKENPEKLTKDVIFFVLPGALKFLAMDVLLNLFFGTLAFLQLPRLDQLLFTARLSHNVNQFSGFLNNYRRKLARFFCGLLDKFDWRQKHCACFEPEDEADKCQ